MAVQHQSSSSHHYDSVISSTATYLNHIHRYCLVKTLLLLLFSWIHVDSAKAIQVTEIMYNPPSEVKTSKKAKSSVETSTKSNDTSYEFIEFYNEKADRLDLGQWQFTQGIKLQFPEGTTIEPRTYFLVAKNPEKLKQWYAKSYDWMIDVPVFGPFQGSLNNRKDHLRLSDPAGGAIIDFAYSDRGQWPMAADGTGHTLTKISPRLHPNRAENWRLSTNIGGTPGKADKPPHLHQNRHNLASVVINEIAISPSHKGRRKSSPISVEIYNPTANTVDISGYWLSDNPTKLKRYQVPEGTQVSAGGHVVFNPDQLDFKLNLKNERLYFTNPSVSRVLDVCQFQRSPTESYLSWGRYPDGMSEWYIMPTSLEKANKVELNTSIVINEIMYHSTSNPAKNEYVEFYNRGTEDVDLSGWSVTGGISFQFPKKTVLVSNAYLVVAKNARWLRSQYDLPVSQVVGNFKQTLSNGEDMVRLKDTLGNQVDQVRYYDGGHWPKSADGYGSSLELINPYQDNNNYQAWSGSNERDKAEWQYISYTRTCTQYRGEEAWPKFHMHLKGAGEVLVDDIRLTSTDMPFFARATRRQGELISNGSFEYGVEDWSVVGTHIDSQTDGDSPQHGRKSFKLIAASAGNTGPNHVQIPLESALEEGKTYTISFWAKWQKGNNLLLTRCSGNQIAGMHRIPTPKRTGTPGGQNSVYQSQTGPIFKNTIHAPAVPIATDTVAIDVQVSDPDDISSVTLYYKPDRATRSSSSAETKFPSGVTSSAYQEVPMVLDTEKKDDYYHYRGQIPAHSAYQTVAFYIQATDKTGATGTWPKDIRLPGLYRIERNRDRVKPELPSYRIIMQEDDVREINSRPSLSNQMMNATFIFNETDIYYQVGCRWTGSPYRRGRSGSPSGYKIRFHADQKLNGVQQMARFDRNDNSPGGYYNERLSYYLLRKMRLPTSQQEWITVRFNSDQGHPVWEDILPPNSRFLSIFYPQDAREQLFEVSSYFDFRGDLGDAGNFESRGADFRWLDSDDANLYRWNYQPRSRESEGDFDNLFDLLKAMNHTPDDQYEAIMDKHINVEQWMRMIATRVVVGDWDFIGNRSGQNAYLYRPGKSKRWELLSWDNEWGYERANMSVWADSPILQRFQKSPKHQHLYFGFMREMMNKYFNVAYLEPRLQHYHQIVGGTSPETLITFIQDRTAYLNQVIPQAKPKIIHIQRNADQLLLQGTAPVETKSVQIAQAGASEVEHEPQWTGATEWRLVLPHTAEPIYLKFLDYDGKPIGAEHKLDQ